MSFLDKHPLLGPGPELSISLVSQVEILLRASPHGLRLPMLLELCRQRAHGKHGGGGDARRVSMEKSLRTLARLGRAAQAPDDPDRWCSVGERVEPVAIVARPKDRERERQILAVLPATMAAIAKACGYGSRSGPKLMLQRMEQDRLVYRTGGGGRSAPWVYHPGGAA